MSQLVRRISSIYIHHITKSNAKVLCQILQPLNHSYPNKKLATPTSLLWSFLFLASHSKLTWRIEDKWQSHGWQHGSPYTIPEMQKKYPKKNIIVVVQSNDHCINLGFKSTRTHVGPALQQSLWEPLPWHESFHRWQKPIHDTEDVLNLYIHVHTVPYISNIV